jgi:hypothetical protein
METYGDKYVANDGTLHETKAGAEGHNASTASGNAMAGGFLLIFIFGPIIAGKIVGFLWGLLLKLGIVGRILTTLLMVVAGPAILALIMAFSGDLFRPGGPFTLGRVSSAVFIVGSALIVPAWYFLWHYDVVKLMGAGGFSSKVQNFCKFLWFGFIGASLIRLIMGEGSEKITAVISIVASLAGLIFYFVSTREYAREAKENPTLRIPLAIKGIVMAVVVGLTVIYGFAAKAEDAAWVANRDLALTGAVTAVPAQNKAQKDIAAAYTAGTTFTIYGPYKILTKPNEHTTAIGEVSTGDKLTSTGKVLFDPAEKTLGYVSVEYNGVEAWVGEMNLDRRKEGKKVNAFDVTNASTQNLTAKVTSKTSIYKGTSFSERVWDIPKGAILNITGEAVVSDSGSPWLPVEYKTKSGDVKSGYILGSSVKIQNK